LPWPDGAVDLIVTSPPLSNSITEALGYVAVRNGSGIGTSGQLLASPIDPGLSPNDVDVLTLAYLAGAMDADGYFSVHKSSNGGGRRYWNKTYSPRIGLGQVTRAVPELLRQTFGGTSMRIEQRGGRHRPIFRWLATNKRAVSACQFLIPYLRLKAEQAKLLVELDTYTRKDVRKAAFWYEREHPNWSEEMLLTTTEVRELLGYMNPGSVYQAIRKGTLLAMPGRDNVRRPRIPAGLVSDILAQRADPATAINRARPPQLQRERERIYQRVRELNRVGTDDT
jgi:hypothetical protein